MGTMVEGEDFSTIGLTPQFCKASDEAALNTPGDGQVGADEAKFLALQVVRAALGGDFQKINSDSARMIDSRAATAAQRIYSEMIGLRRAVQETLKQVEG